jgi:hypothetical protein
MSEHEPESRNAGWFWPVIIGLAFVAPLLPAIFVRTPLGQMKWPMTVSQRLPYYAATAILAFAIWAILFRGQIEKLRIRIVSLFVLVLLEAVLLLAIRFAHPFWAIGGIR